MKKGIIFNVFRVVNINLDHLLEIYPQNNTGTKVVSIEKNNDNYIVFLIGHGTPKSDTLRHKIKGTITPKDPEEIDEEYDYLILHKKSKYLFATGGLNSSQVQRILISITNNKSPIKVEAFYSAEKLIKKLSVINEISLVTKPKKVSKDESLSERIISLHKDPLGGNRAENIITKFQYEGESIQPDDQDKISNLLIDLNYENVSIKGTSMDEKFQGVICSKEVMTRIKLGNLFRENGRIDLSKIDLEFSNYFDSKDFDLLSRDIYGYQSKD